jgi:hypothetical protein
VPVARSCSGERTVEVISNRLTMMGTEDLCLAAPSRAKPGANLPGL